MNVQTPEPRPDRHAIARYCETLFGYLDGVVPIRLISEKGTPSRPVGMEAASIAEVAGRLAALAPLAAQRSQGLYVVPATVASGPNARVADIMETGVLLIDLDAGDISAARDHLVRHVGLPSIEVASGGITAVGQTKLHLYWRLTEAARGDDLHRVARLRSELAAKAGGDPSLGSIHQPIRVAGSIHGKNGHRAPVRLLTHSDMEYDLAEITDAIETMPALLGAAALPAVAIGTGTGGRVGPSARQLMTQPIREGAVDGTTRFQAMSSVIGHWLRNVRLGESDLTAAWTAVEQYNLAMIVPPWGEDRLRREFDRLRVVDRRNHPEVGPDVAVDDESGPPLPPPQSEDALAAAFVRDHGTDWRYVATWGSWLRWTGSNWMRDETSAIREQVRQVCRAASAETPNAAQARKLSSDRTITAVVRIAGADPAVATTPEDWDAHPMLLNTPACVIDLETGESLPHDPRRLLTQMTSASTAIGCPRWLDFLDQVLGGDRDLLGYVQRFCGYCLTGSTLEQAFVFLHGQGANGKSVFLQTLAAVLGTYAATATLETFMASRSDRHLTELAGLRGARLVLVPETEPDRAWAEGRIKAVTGGERIRANYMRQNHFEFTPQFKLIVAGNHRPALARTGEAMRRRLHLVPSP